jgi:ABC-type phosphate transport system substrate-binding protein
MRPSIRRLLGVVCLVICAVKVDAAELVIIGNPGLREPKIDTKGLQRIYLGKLTRWADDQAIVPVMLKSGPVHDEFVESYLDRSLHRFVTYWRQMVFTGKGMPPRSFADEKELVAFVAATPGAVGYASSKADTKAVKVLTVAGN